MINPICQLLGLWIQPVLYLVFKPFLSKCMFSNLIGVLIIYSNPALLVSDHKEVSVVKTPLYLHIFLPNLLRLKLFELVKLPYVSPISQVNLPLVNGISDLYPELSLKIPMYREVTGLNYSFFQKMCLIKLLQDIRVRSIILLLLLSHRTTPPVCSLDYVHGPWKTPREVANAKFNQIRNRVIPSNLFCSHYFLFPIFDEPL